MQLLSFTSTFSFCLFIYNDRHSLETSDDKKKMNADPINWSSYM